MTKFHAKIHEMLESLEQKVSWIAVVHWIFLSLKKGQNYDIMSAYHYKALKDRHL